MNALYLKNSFFNLLHFFFFPKYRNYIKLAFDREDNIYGNMPKDSASLLFNVLKELNSAHFLAFAPQ